MTYVDNDYNRRKGRVGKPLGTHVVHKDGSKTITPVTSTMQQPVQQSTNLNAGTSHAQSWRSSTQRYPATSPPNSAFNTLSRPSPNLNTSPNPPMIFVRGTFGTYEDNPSNRGLGRVGKPYGTHVHHRSSGTATIQDYIIVDPLTPPHTPPQASTRVGTAVKPPTTTQPFVGRQVPCGTVVQPSRLFPLSSTVSGTATVSTLPFHKQLQQLTLWSDSDLRISPSTSAQPVSDSFTGVQASPPAILSGQDHTKVPDSSTSTNQESPPSSQDHTDSANTRTQVPDSPPSSPPISPPSTPSTSLSPSRVRSSQEITSNGNIPEHNVQEFLISPEEVKVTQQVVVPGTRENLYCGRWRGMKVAFLKIDAKLKREKWMTDLKHEVRYLCKLNHPNVVRLYGAVLTKKPCGAVMEYIPCSLYQVIFVQERELDTEDRMGIVSQTAEGLSFLHSKNIVHCCLNSKEVLVTEYNVVKIGGYGPRFQTSVIESTHDFVRESEPCYTAPEILRNELLTAEQLMKADIYSMAVIAYEVLEAKKVCDAMSDQARNRSLNLESILRAERMSQFMFNTLCKCWRAEAGKRPTVSKFITYIGTISSCL